MRQGYIGGLVLALAVAGTLAGCAVSTQEEVTMGQQYAGEVAKQMPLITDPPIIAYLTELGGQITKVADDRNLQWSFHLVDSKEVNAFAIPGGFIYVNRGLVERARNMSELAGVLGHEIGHVTQRHSVKQMQKARGAGIGVVLGCTLLRACNSDVAQGTINIASSAVFAKFSRTDEAEADREGVKYVIRAGIDPNGIPEMFDILLEERKQRPDAVEALVASHPLEEDRVKQARALIATYDPAVLRGLAKDDERFQAFKRRVLALPPSPTPKKQ